MPFVCANDVEHTEPGGGVPVPRSEGRGNARALFPLSVRGVPLSIAAVSLDRGAACGLQTKI